MNKQLFKTIDDYDDFRKSFRHRNELDRPDFYPAILVWDVGYMDVFEFEYVYIIDFPTATC